MKKVTLCYCVREGKVLLGMKRCGFGVGKWNGFGGKVKEGESSKQASIRELHEESGLTVDENEPKQCALIRFFFEQEFAFECDVYLVRNWEGEPVETEEMSPKWYSISDLPFGEMWVADPFWLPRVLEGETLEVFVRFNEKGDQVLEHNIKTAVFE